MRQTGSEFELDCLPSPTRIGPKGTRPRWPHMLIVVEADSGVIVGIELIDSSDGLPALWNEIPGKLLSILSQFTVRPARIRVRSTLYHDLLKPLLNALDVKITKRSALPAIEEAWESLVGFMTPR